MLTLYAESCRAGINLSGRQALEVMAQNLRNPISACSCDACLSPLGSACGPPHYVEVRTIAVYERHPCFMRAPIYYTRTNRVFGVPLVLADSPKAHIGVPSKLF